MIISLRGANGAGKTTIARAVMARYDALAEIAYPPPGRRKMLGNVLTRAGGRGLFVPGHYRIANGGIDNVADLSLVYDLIEKHHRLGMDVLYEGHNQEDGAARLLALRAAGLPCRAILLDTSVAECVAGVRARGHRIAAVRIERLHAKLARDMRRLESGGVRCARLGRVDALREICRVLRLPEKRS